VLTCARWKQTWRISLADTFRQAMGADVGLVNGGSIRADMIIKPGVLTKRDVLSMLPFNNRVVKLQVTGAVIRSALENGVATAAEEVQPGRFARSQVFAMRSTPAGRPAGES